MYSIALHLMKQSTFPHPMALARSIKLMRGRKNKANFMLKEGLFMGWIEGHHHRKLYIVVLKH